MEGGREGGAESGGMAAKKLEPHTEMWGMTRNAHGQWKSTDTSSDTKGGHILRKN